MFLLGCSNSSDDSVSEQDAGELANELKGDRIPGLGRVERALCVETDQEVICTVASAEGLVATCRPATAGGNSGVDCGRVKQTAEPVKANSCVDEQREATAAVEKTGELDFSVVCAQLAR